MTPDSPDLASVAAGAGPLRGPESDPVLQLAHLVPAMRRVTRTATDLPVKEPQVTMLGINPLVPGDAVSVDRSELERGRASYRFLVHRNRWPGRPELQDLRGDHQPDMVGALEDAAEWLASATCRRVKACWRPAFGTS